MKTQGMMTQKSLRVGVLMGGASAEREISLKTGRSICDALKRRGYTVIPIEVDASLPHQIRAKKISVAFLALHGPGGEDGTVQGMLEVMKMPYTGSGVSASAVCMNKGLTRVVLQAAKVPVPPGMTVSGKMIPVRPPPNLGMPVVVKPCAEGSTFGVSIVRKPSQWKEALQEAYRYGEQLVVEKYIPGREVAVGVFGNEVLPGVEIIVPGGFYDFTAKYGKAATRYVCPASLSSKLKTALREYSFRAYQALGCRGAARVDFRIHTNGRPYILELNTIPGMTERSLLPMAAAQIGWDYDDLVERILREALQKREIPSSGKKRSTRSSAS
ncbi:MAG: D-alanine--D-alanine ligase [Nitrospirales bacterium]|nr:MAG: D-alanine--D-alanine ligase [Nitrospirales bacterium]